MMDWTKVNTTKMMVIKEKNNKINNVYRLYEHMI